MYVAVVFVVDVVWVAQELQDRFCSNFRKTVTLGQNICTNCFLTNFQNQPPFWPKVFTSFNNCTVYFCEPRAVSPNQGHNSKSRFKVQTTMIAYCKEHFDIIQNFVLKSVTIQNPFGQKSLIVFQNVNS